MNMIDWKPIATAPKDGRELLLGVDWKRLVYIGYHTDEVGTGKTGWVASEFFGSARFCPYQPTHWADLPSAPLASRVAQAEPTP